MPVTVQVDDSAYVAMVAAIAQLATTNAGLTFGGFQLWEIPTWTQLQAAAFPFFVVRFGTGVDDSDLPGMESGALLMDGEFDAWEFDIYALYYYDESNPNWGDAANAMVKLKKVFRANVDLGLGPQVYACRVRNPTLTYLTLDGGTCLAAKLTLRVYEQIGVLTLVS